MRTWQELRQLPDAELAKIDLAMMNLACAADLPEANLEPTDALNARLDAWTAIARTAPAFANPNGKSLAYYRMQQVVASLRDAVRAVGNVSGDKFLADDQGADVLLLDLLNGTSYSRSAFLVLCVAIGRRLGYPLKLLATRGEKFFYLFGRWDDGKGETFNIDVCPEGMCSRPDEYYRMGPHEVDARSAKYARLMSPMKPREELAFFLGGRGLKWEALGDYRKALDAFAWASAINNGNAMLREILTQAIKRWRAHLNPRIPPHFPELAISLESRRYPATLMYEQEKAIIVNETIEMLLGTEEQDKKYWEPMRRGQTLESTPIEIHVLHTATGSHVKMILKDTRAAAASDRIAEMLNPGFLERRHAEVEYHRTATPPKETPQKDSERPKPVRDGPLTIEQLIHMTEEELAQVDIAEMNLVCAKGLPGTNDLDIPACLRKIDEWAEFIRDITERNKPRYESHPEVYLHSWATFRVVTMVRILQRNLGMKYNEDRKRNLYGDDFFNRPEDIFIHGILSGNGGTCTSVPVLCVAVGRRLGYPLKLVHTACHQFFHWDEPGGERINFEASSNLGLNTYPDDHYLSWPQKLKPEEVEAYRFLESRTPRAELSSFLGSRGRCWLGNENYCKALKCFGWSSYLDKENVGGWCPIVEGLRTWREKLKPRIAKALPRFLLTFPKRCWIHLTWECESEIIRLAVLEDLLRDYRFKKLADRAKKRGKLPDWAPQQIKIAYPDRLMYDI